MGDKVHKKSHLIRLMARQIVFLFVHHGPALTIVGLYQLIISNYKNINSEVESDPGSI
jgi:hypothetical protein